MDNNSSRRRGLGVVTPNACTECRKKRSKCDGQKPCGRCTAQRAQCIYETPVRQSKEHMRNEMDRLRTRLRRHEQVLGALATKETSDTVLSALQNGKKVEEIVENLGQQRPASRASGSNVTTFSRLQDQQAIGSALNRAKSIASSPASMPAFSASPQSQTTHQQEEGKQHQQWSVGSHTKFQDAHNGMQQDDIMKWAPDMVAPGPLVATWHEHSHAGSTPDSMTQKARGEGQETILGETFGTEEHSRQSRQDFPNHNQSWTNVTSNAAFVEHLLALYFCWEYPTFASLSKEHFLDHFKTGNPRYCSSLLVNAILALGCRFSNQPQARTNPDDPNTAGDHFFAETLRLLNAEEDRHILTTIQAMGLMSIREASCGRSSESIFYAGQSIRLAMEMGLHLDIEIGQGEEAEIEHAVRSATFWGAFSLDQAWSLSIGRLPHFSLETKLVTKPAIIDHIERSSWIPYTDDGAPLEKGCTQPSNVRSVYRTFCELSEIVHKSLYTLYAPGTKLTAQNLLKCYTMYLKWYEAIPTSLRLGHNFTPAVLFAHMYYHYAILLLFRPFIKLSIPSSSVSPRSMCKQAAAAISTLVTSYRKLYTLRRVPSLIPYFLLTGSIAHLVALGNGDRAREVVVKGAISDLKEMSWHGFSGRAIEILCYLGRAWGIDVELDSLRTSPELQQNHRQPTQDAMEGVTSDDNSYGVNTSETASDCRTVSTSFNLFTPNIGLVDITAKIGKVDLSAGDNPLFWCFPLQGRPLLKFGEKELEEAGFKVLDD